MLKLNAFLKKKIEFSLKRNKLKVVGSILNNSFLITGLFSSLFTRLM